MYVFLSSNITQKLQSSFTEPSEELRYSNKKTKSIISSIVVSLFKIRAQVLLEDVFFECPSVLTNATQYILHFNKSILSENTLKTL